MNKKAAFLLIAVILIFQWKHSTALESLVKEKKVAARAVAISDRGGDMLGFSDEISLMLENSCGIECRDRAEDYFDRIDRADIQAEYIDPYSLFSGGVSLRKALQFERVGTDYGTKGTIDPASLNSPLTEKLPYKDMLKGRKCRVYRIDRYTPADFYYLHISDAGKITGVIDCIENIACALRRRISTVSVDYKTTERITTLLAVSMDEKLGQLYSSCIEEMVITGSDPYIMEGSDITLIIRPRKPKPLTMKINEIRREYKYRYRCSETPVSISGVSGTLLSSGGRMVHSLIFTLPDGTIIISNSLKGAETVINTYSGRHPSLADAPDYLYTRSVFPAEPGGEDAFLYISDLFVKHLSSPALKITEARRVSELMRMAVLEKYAIYYYLLNGKRSSSVKEIAAAAGKASLNSSRKKELAAIKKNSAYKRAVKLDKKHYSKWPGFQSEVSKNSKGKSSKKRRSGATTLTNAMKVFYRNMTGSSAKTPGEVMDLIDSCNSKGADNSSRFEGLGLAEGGFTAVSDKYGRAGFMVPCIDVEAKPVTGDEASDYRDFVTNYSSSGEALISPGGIKLSIGRAVSAEAFIFRSGQNPFYSLFSSFAGGGPLSLHPDSAMQGEILSISLKPDLSALDSFFYMKGIRTTGADGKNICMKDLLSGEVQLHIRDSLPPAGFDFSAISRIFNYGGYGYSDAVSGFFIWAMLHPVRLAVPVKSGRDAASAVESAMNRIAERLNSGNMVRCNTFSFEYRGTEIKVLRMTMLGSLTAGVFSAVKNGTLHLSTDEKYIKTVLIDRAPVKEIGIRGNAAFVFRPSALNRERGEYRSGILEDAILKSRKNFGTIKLASLIYPDASAGSLPDLIYRDFGFRPVCPLGGGYLIEKKSGEVYSPIFGSYMAPMLRGGVKENGPVYEGLEDFFSTSEIRAEMEFVKEGMMLRFRMK